MRSEKEIRERLESLRDMEKREWEVFREIYELEWVLDGQSEAVAKPLLADVRAIADKYGRWERVRKGGKVVPHIVISKRSFDKMLRELSEHFR